MPQIFDMAFKIWGWCSSPTSTVAVATLSIFLVQKNDTKNSSPCMDVLLHFRYYTTCKAKVTVIMLHKAAVQTLLISLRLCD